VSGQGLLKAPVKAFVGKGLMYGRMIRFSHTVFALPFALSAVVLAQRTHSLRASDLFWILIAMVAARSAAMGFNRIADAELDRRNPRTRHRDIPAGRMPLASAALFVAVSSLIFMLSAAMLGRLCFYLSIPALAVLFSYSYTKRFTRWCHLYLGFAISMAPMGAWIAVTDQFSWKIAWLCLALMTYIAGFDMIYACQDTDFDKDQGLFSIPARWGVKTALSLSAMLHFVSLVCFFIIYIVFDLHLIYLGTVVLIGGLFMVEHRLVNPDDLSNIQVAFFHVNSIISVVLFLGILADELVRRWN
jgi:4-hydroxybenzoate polyprenyltransferase